MIAGRNVVKFGVVAAGVIVAAAACTSSTGGTDIAHTNSAAPASPTRSPSTGASPSSSLAAGGGGSSVSACRIQDLVVRLGQPDSAKFQEGATIELANTGEACVVSGYLGLRLLDERGVPVPTTVRKLRRDDMPAAPVTMVRGGRAYATLVWNKYEGQGTVCRPYPARIAVALPGQTATVTAPWASGVSASVCQGALSVSALRAAP